MLKRISLLLVLSVIAGPWVQAACLNEFSLTHPDYRYEEGAPVGGEAVVKDLETGLEWSRCPVGFSYDANTGCVASGNSNDYNLNWLQAHENAALYPVGSGSFWRVPNAKELQSLIAATCTSRAINAFWFPNAGNGDFWTSTPNAKQPDQAWKINLNTGYSSILNKNVNRRVYLVR